MKKLKKTNDTNVFLENLKTNSKVYAILLLLFLIGIVVGIFFLNHTNLEEKQEVKNYVHNFIDFAKEEEYINYSKLLINSLIKNISFASILWLIGITVTLIPIVYGIIFFRGFCFGYTISALIGTLGIKDGLFLSCTALLLQNLTLIPAIMGIAVSSIIFNNRVLRADNTEANRQSRYNRKNIKFEILRHCFCFLIWLCIIILSSLIEVYISTHFTGMLIKNKNLI